MQVTDEMVRAGALALNARTGGNEARFKHMQEVYMAEARAALTAALAAMWQPIETAPKDGTPLWVIWPNEIQEQAWFAEGVWQTHEYRDGVSPTHWRPLPAPPEHSVAERNDVKEKSFVHNLAESK